MTRFFAAAVAAFTLFAGNAQAATFCVDFDNFVDGLEVDVVGQNITGTWKNWDAYGATAPVSGQLTGNGARVACTDASCPSGADWLFLFNGANGTFDMYTGTVQVPVQIQASQPYTVTPGTCPFRLAPGGRTSTRN